MLQFFPIFEACDASYFVCFFFNLKNFIILTIASGVTYAIWFHVEQYYSSHFYYSRFYFSSNPRSFLSNFLETSCPCFVIAMIFLILLQYLDKCSECCCPCLPCCRSNCYPVTKFTYLDVNNMDVVITQEEIELDQDVIITQEEIELDQL